MGNARYVDTLKDANILVVCGKLGLDVVEGHGTSPGSFACPVCGVDKRHDEEKRGACGITSTGKGWSCFACEAKGDAINLVCLKLAGMRDLRECTDAQRGEIKEWCEENTGATPAAERPTLKVVRTPPKYPTAEVLAGIWERCVPVDEDEEVCAWLVSKNIDPVVVTACDLARALPADAGGSWGKSGRRLISPLRDAEGVIRNVKGRMIVKSELPKSVSIKGFAMADLAFFDPAARDYDLVIFCEGEKKQLQFSTHYPKAMVYGIGSGMISDELVSRVPEDVDIFLAVDPNEAGAKYATDIMRRLNEKQRARVTCWKGLTVSGSKGKLKFAVAKEVM